MGTHRYVELPTDHLSPLEIMILGSTSKTSVHFPGPTSILMRKYELLGSSNVDFTMIFDDHVDVSKIIESFGTDCSSIAGCKKSWRIKEKDKTESTLIDHTAGTRIEIDSNFVGKNMRFGSMKSENAELYLTNMEYLGHRQAAQTIVATFKAELWQIIRELQQTSPTILDEVPSLRSITNLDASWDELIRMRTNQGGDTAMIGAQPVRHTGTENTGPHDDWGMYAFPHAWLDIAIDEQTVRRDSCDDKDIKEPQAHTYDHWGRYAFPNGSAEL